MKFFSLAVIPNTATSDYFFDTVLSFHKYIQIVYDSCMNLFSLAVIPNTALTYYIYRRSPEKNIQYFFTTIIE
jgi:hypothetical protein